MEESLEAKEVADGELAEAPVEEGEPDLEREPNAEDLSEVEEGKI